MFVQIASVQSLVSSQRVRVVFCVRQCPLGNFHSQAPVQPWMSPWAEAVGWFVQPVEEELEWDQSHFLLPMKVTRILEPAVQGEHRERARGHRHWLQQGNFHLN